MMRVVGEDDISGDGRTKAICVGQQELQSGNNLRRERVGIHQEFYRFPASALSAIKSGKLRRVSSGSIRQIATMADDLT
jgi:hypothetical protein